MTHPPEHCPKRQTLFVQTVPHAPQLLLSDWRSTHGSFVEQHVWPPVHPWPVQTPA